MSETLSPTPYIERRTRIETYFDRTAIEAWTQLTSDAPVSKIRATVRAGRDQMRAILLDQLPQDLRGRRLLDAGCGSGALAVEAARRGADVVAIDISERLIALAKERTPQDLGGGSIEFGVGDMLAASHGVFDHAVLMDSLIHYEPGDAVEALGGLAGRVTRSIHFTYAPNSAALSLMHAAGRLFPRGDRAPSIVPVSSARLRSQLLSHPRLIGWRIGRDERVKSGFYTSHAQELRAPETNAP